MTDTAANVVKPQIAKTHGRTRKRVLTTQEKWIIRAFCDLIYEHRYNSTFTLWNVQGGLRFVNPGVPDEQTYSDLLPMATEEGWIEPVEGQPDT